jgi:hypothetical protein
MKPKKERESAKKAKAPSAEEKTRIRDFSSPLN